MAESFFENFSSQPIQVCKHDNNDGVSCHDCFELIEQCFGASFHETHNYFPRRIAGNIIKRTDLNGIIVPPAVFLRAQELFQIVTENKIYRGPTRIGVIAGCLIHAFKMEKYFVSFHELVASLGVSTKKCLVGLQQIDLCLFAKDRQRYDELSKNNLTFIECANDIAKKLNICINNVNFEKWALKLNKHCRLTTAAAVSVWLYIEHSKLPITIEQVANAAQFCSVNTIKKLSNETQFT